MRSTAPVVGGTVGHATFGIGTILSVSYHGSFYRVEALFPGGWRLNVVWREQQ